MNSLVEVDELNISVKIGAGERQIVAGTSFTVAPGESLGLVGESGSGKSLTARSLLRLLPPAFRVGGDIRFDGVSIKNMTKSEVQRYRAEDVAMIFQDPKAHTNPVRKIGDFLTEVERDAPRGRSTGAGHAVALLEELGIRDAARRFNQYPHELSGGMLQRVMIGAALLKNPKLLIADEPTTALDVTTQSDIMANLGEFRQERHLALLFITHDLELASATCDRIAVMYAGTIVELAPAADLGRSPHHPYTAALLRSRARIDRRLPRLEAVPGRPISAYESPAGCPFAPRCPLAVERCTVEAPSRRQVGESWVACHRAELTSTTNRTAQGNA